LIFMDIHRNFPAKSSDKSIRTIQPSFIVVFNSKVKNRTFVITQKKIVIT